MGKEPSSGKLHYGYVVLIGACLMMLPQSLPINTASIFYTPVTAELGIGISEFSIHTSIISLSIFLTTSLMTKLFHRFDIRFFLSAVIIVEAICFLLYSLATSIWVFYLASFFIGAALSVLVYLVVPILVNNWFSVRTSLYIGIGTCMQGIGGALFTFLGAHIIQAHGWRACYVFFGIVTLLVGIPISIAILRKNPRDKGLQPVGINSRTGRGKSNEVPSSTPPSVDVKTAFKSISYVLIIAACLCLSTGVIFNYYLNSYALMLGMSLSSAGIASATVMVGMCVGKIALGALCDKSVRLGIIVGGFCGIIALCVLAGLAQEGLGFILLACFMFGVTYASSSLLGAVLTRYVFGPGDFDIIWPSIGRFIALGNAFGAFLWGAVVEGLGYSVAMLAVMFVFAAAITFALMAVTTAEKLRKSI